MPTCNSTLSDEYIRNEKPLYGSFTFHHVGLFICAVFGLIATCIGLFLVFMHATHYLKPWEQKHIIRILLLIPIYSVVSFLSYLFYRHAIYYDVLEGCYEAFAISSFFTLLCAYIAPNLHDQKEYFRSLKPVNWFWGVFGLQLCTGGENKGPFRKPRSGLTWFNIIWIGVFQYCFVRVLFTIIAVITQIFDVYCVDSLSPAFAHVWIQVIEAISVTIAMFCLIQFYIQLRVDLAEHKPFLKVLCIKLVIFFSFWQTIIISFLSSSHGPLQPTATLAYPDIKVGIPSVLLCIEMAIFAVMHIFAFGWKPYSIKHSYSDPIHQPGTGFGGGGDGSMKYRGGPLGIYALMDAFNPWDIIKMTARGFRWLFIGYRIRQQDVSYQNPSKLGLDGSTGYTGPTYAGSGEAATELRPSTTNDSSRGRSDTAGAVGAADDDRAGLLTHQGRMGRGAGPIPYRPLENDEYTSGDDSQVDLSAPNQRSRPRPPPLPGTAMTTLEYDAKASDFGPDLHDTGYHPAGYAAPSTPTIAEGAGAGAQGLSGGVHPAFRQEPGAQAHDWNMFAGAEGRQRPADNESVAGRPPPRYRTYDSHG